MISRSRPALLALVLALVLGTATAAYALRTSAAQDPQPVQSVHRYWRTGPVAAAGSDYQSQVAMSPLRVAVPEGSWDAVVTVSFDYRTHGPGPFRVEVSVGRARVRPASHVLAPAEGGSRPVSVRFLLSDLAGGRTYDLLPVARPASPSGAGENRIGAGRTLMTVDLTPAD